MKKTLFMCFKRILSIFFVFVLTTSTLFCISSFASADKDPEITVSVFIDGWSELPKGNKVYQQIQKKLGIKYQMFQFDNIPSFSRDQQFRDMIDSKKLPDLWYVDNHDNLDLLVKEGVLIDLLPYITEEETPNLYKHLYTDNRIRKILTKDGKLYFFPNRGIFYNDEIQIQNGPAFFIQKQVIAWNKYVVPKTLNEYFDLIERFISANPQDKNGNPYTGFAILCEDWRRFCLTHPVQYLMGHHNDGDVMVDNIAPDYHTETFIDKPYAKSYYAKLNEEYNKGLIMEDTFSLTYDQYNYFLSYGTVLGLFDQTWNLGNVDMDLKGKKKFENTYMAIPLVYDPEYVDGKEIEEHYLAGSNIGNSGIGISSACEYPERLIKMLDTLLEDEWQIMINWGFKGSNYSVKKGRMLMNKGQFNKITFDPLLDAFPKKQGTMDDGNSWDPKLQPENQQNTLDKYDINFLKKLGKTTWSDYFNTPQKVSPYGEAWEITIDDEKVSQMRDEFYRIEDKRLPEIIMCDPADFDKKWDAFVKEITPSAKIYTDYMQKEILKLVEKNTKPIEILGTKN